ncbi:hypothetical protein GCM10022202_06540 [Microbacterium marinilacus]|uniref:Helix-turn-helix domain-containing protein n=1 Tax=Microbacterium marinilacus TaxID=415209 RepID=A0ABP7B646_9MICO
MAAVFPAGERPVTGRCPHPVLRTDVRLGARHPALCTTKEVMGLVQLGIAVRAGRGVGYSEVGSITGIDASSRRV